MAIFVCCKVQVFFLRKADTAGGGMEVRLNKNAYSTIDLSARRSAQMGIRLKEKRFQLLILSPPKRTWSINYG